MRPILVYVPALPAFLILISVGALLSAIGLLPRFRKTQAFSY